MLPYGIIILCEWYQTIPKLYSEVLIMNIKTELLKRYISDYINNRIEDFDLDADDITNTLVIDMLEEIQRIIKNEDYTDFEVVEEIVILFQKHGLDFGSRHDF